MATALRPSIVSGHIVKQLREQMKQAQRDIYGTRMPVTLDKTTGYAGRDESWSVKFCARANGRGGYYESGGIVIEAAIQRPVTGAYRDCTFSRRLPEGYSDQRFYNAVTRIWHEVNEAQRLNAAREGLYNALEGENRKVSLSEQDLLDVQETGHESAYQSMSSEDIEFWWGWLRARYPEAFGQQCD